MRKITFPDLLGWYGATAILIGFFLIDFSYLTASSILYQLLSLSGGLGIAINSYYKKAYPSVVLNSIFTLIAIVALFRILRS